MPGKTKFTIIFSAPLNLRFIIMSLLCFFFAAANAQDVVAEDTLSTNVTDMGDILKKMFKKKNDTTTTKKQKNIALLPSIGYNPSFGFVIGAKVSAIKQYGQKENTNLSSFGLEGLFTSKGIITGQARHNVFTAENKLNFQGNWQLSKFLIEDYNIGTGNKEYLTKSDSAFLIKFNYIRLSEKVYKKI